MGYQNSCHWLDSLESDHALSLMSNACPHRGTETIDDEVRTTPTEVADNVMKSTFIPGKRIELMGNGRLCWSEGSWS